MALHQVEWIICGYLLVFLIEARRISACLEHHPKNCLISLDKEKLVFRFKICRWLNLDFSNIVLLFTVFIFPLVYLGDEMLVFLLD